MGRLVKRLANRVIIPETLASMDSVKDLNLDDEEIYIDHEDIYLGLQTKTKLKARLDEGDISNY